MAVLWFTFSGRMSHAYIGWEFLSLIEHPRQIVSSFLSTAHFACSSCLPFSVMSGIFVLTPVFVGNPATKKKRNLTFVFLVTSLQNVCLMGELSVFFFVFISVVFVICNLTVVRSNKETKIAVDHRTCLRYWQSSPIVVTSIMSIVNPSRQIIHLYFGNGYLCLNVLKIIIQINCFF